MEQVKFYDQRRASLMSQIDTEDFGTNFICYCDISFGSFIFS
jgi:hypothetical protein